MLASAVNVIYLKLTDSYNMIVVICGTANGFQKVANFVFRNFIWIFILGEFLILFTKIIYNIAPVIWYTLVKHFEKMFILKSMAWTEPEILKYFTQLNSITSPWCILYIWCTFADLEYVNHWNQRNELMCACLCVCNFCTLFSITIWVVCSFIFFSPFSMVCNCTQRSYHLDQLCCLSKIAFT